jgi:flagellar M-ring protein FliF
MAALRNTARQFNDIWARLSAAHRIALVALALVCGAALVAVVRWSSRTEYQVLAADLTPKDAATLATSLQDAGIQCRVNDRGTALLVDVARMQEARIAAAEAGLSGATGGGGFDAFEKPRFGQTPAAQRVMYLNALQNELARTISDLEPVEYARVHLVLPERKLFPGERKAPTASVLVVARPNRVLRPSTAQAIASLVAGAVEGLVVDNVTITDEDGMIIAGSDESAAGAAASDRFAYRQRVENYLSAQAEGMLARVLGKGRCKVRVNAQFAFEDSKEMRKTYDPNTVKSRERIESSSDSTPSGGSAGGQDGEADRGRAADPAVSNTETIETEWMVSSVVSEQVRRGASISKLTVAAFVDLEGDADQAAPDESEGTEAGPTATQLALADVERIIREAVGFDESRGDSLNVVQARFQRSEPVVAQAGFVDRYGHLGKWGAVGVLALVLLLVARRALKAVESRAPRHVMVPEIVTGEGDGSGRVSHEELLQKELSRFVEGSPDVATRVIEGWVEAEE